MNRWGTESMPAWVSAHGNLVQVPYIPLCAVELIVGHECCLLISKGRQNYFPLPRMADRLKSTTSILKELVENYADSINEVILGLLWLLHSPSCRVFAWTELDCNKYYHRQKLVWPTYSCVLTGDRICIFFCQDNGIATSLGLLWPEFSKDGWQQRTYAKRFHLVDITIAKPSFFTRSNRDLNEERLWVTHLSLIDNQWFAASSLTKIYPPNIWQLFLTPSFFDFSSGN